MNLQILLGSFLALTVSYSSCGKSKGNASVDSSTVKVIEPTYRTVDSVDEMAIFTVNLRILTPIDVTCDNFGSYFSSPKETKITRTTERDSVLKMLSETKSIGKTFSRKPDTRGTISVTYTSKLIETFCFDDQLIYLDDSTYYMSPAFREYLYKVSGTQMPK